MKLFRKLAIIVLLGVVPVAAWGKTLDVSITDQGFDPPTLYVNKGDTVRWTNKGTSLQGATSGTVIAPGLVTADGNFDSGRLNPGVSFEHTFVTFGTIKYFGSSNVTATGTLNVGDTYVTISPASSLLHPEQSFDLLVFLKADPTSLTLIRFDGKEIFNGDFSSLMSVTNSYDILHYGVGAGFVAAIAIKPHTLSPGVHKLTVDVITPTGAQFSDAAIYTVAEPSGGMFLNTTTLH